MSMSSAATDKALEAFGSCYEKVSSLKKMEATQRAATSADHKALMELDQAIGSKKAQDGVDEDDESVAAASFPAKWYFNLNRFKWFKYLHFYSLITLSVINFLIDVTIYANLLNVKRTLVLGPPSPTQIDAVLLTLLLQFSIIFIEVGQLWDELFNNGAYSGDLTNSKLASMFSIWLQYLPSLWLNLHIVDCYQRVFFVSYLKAFFMTFISIMRTLIFVFNNILSDYHVDPKSPRRRYIYDYFKNFVRIVTFLGIVLIVICTLTIQVGFLRVKTSSPPPPSPLANNNRSNSENVALHKNFDIVDVYMNFEVYIESTEADLIALDDSLKLLNENAKDDSLAAKVKKYYAKSKTGKNQQLPNLMLLGMPRIQYTYDKMMRLTNVGEMMRNGGKEFIVIEKHVMFTTEAAAESGESKKTKTTNKNVIFICVAKWYPLASTAAAGQEDAAVLKRKKIKPKTTRKECYKVDVVKVMAGPGTYTNNYYVKRLLDTSPLDNEDKIRLVSKHLFFLDYQSGGDNSLLISRLSPESSWGMQLLNYLNTHDAIMNPRLVKIGNLQFTAFKLEDPNESDDLTTYIKKCMYRTPPFFRFSNIGILQLYIDPNTEQKSKSLLSSLSTVQAASEDDMWPEEYLARSGSKYFQTMTPHSKTQEFYVKDRDLMELNHLKVTHVLQDGHKQTTEDLTRNKCHLQVNSFAIWNENAVFLNDKICETVLISTV